MVSDGSKIASKYIVSILLFKYCGAVAASKKDKVAAATPDSVFRQKPDDPMPRSDIARETLEKADPGCNPVEHEGHSRLPGMPLESIGWRFNPSEVTAWQLGRHGGAAIASDNRYVDGGKPPGALLDIQGNRVSFGQRPEPGSIDSGVMDEDIRSILRFNETRALFVIKPFYGSVGHCENLLSAKSRSPASGGDVKTASFRKKPARPFGRAICFKIF
jgi:hypothetical protein